MSADDNVSFLHTHMVYRYRFRVQVSATSVDVVSYLIVLNENRS